MDDIGIALARIELYKDIAKIGIPAFMGMIAGLIPYCIEKQKLKNAENSESVKFRREQVNTLIDLFSTFSGNLFRCVSILYSGHNTGGKIIEKVKNDAVEKTLDNEIHLKKARAISAMLGHPKIEHCLNSFDSQASETIKILNKRGDPNDSKNAIEKLKQAEKEVLNSFDELFCTGANKKLKRERDK